MTKKQQACLSTGCDALNITLSSAQQQQLLDYVALLAKWNKAYNLTAVRDADEMISRHILDSLAILPYIQGSSLLDVGTGAGLPGIPLAIAMPELAVTLLDSNSKKTRFLQQAKAELSLDNISVVHSRVEDAIFEVPFDVVTARAFAAVAMVTELAGAHCAATGYLLLMTGTAETTETVGLLAGFEVAQVEAIHVPDNSGARHVVKLIRR